jgi:hypothetical protein
MDKDWIPGDWGYISNRKWNLENWFTPILKDLYQGEHIIYLGKPDKYWGWDKGA